MSLDLNKVQIIGRITSDAELKQTPSGQSVISFTIATNRSWKDSSGNKQEQAEWHNIVLWGKLAEILDQYGQKGKKVYIEGRLQTRSWDAQDGTKRYKTEIIGENLILLEKADISKKDVEDVFPNEPVKKSDEISIEDIPF